MLRRLATPRLPLGGGVLSTTARAMSRIGKMPVRVPEAVTVSIEPIDPETLPARKPRTLYRLAGILKRRPSAESLAMFGTPLRVTATGPLGEETVNVHSLLQVTNEEGVLSVTPRCQGTSKLGRSLWGGTRGYLDNAVKGVSRGFRKGLELHGIGYKASMEEREHRGARRECLVMRVGFSHEVVVPVPPGIKISIPTATSISVFGTSKQKVGVLASRIRLVKKPDPYKGKGIRYEGEVVKLKQGKKK